MGMAVVQWVAFAPLATALPHRVQLAHQLLLLQVAQLQPLWQQLLRHVCWMCCDSRTSRGSC